MSKKLPRRGSKAPSPPASSTPPRASVPQPNLLLKRARLQRGWSQQEVADQVGAPHAFMVNRWENGVIFPGPGYRQKLCALFEQSASELGLVRAAEMSPQGSASLPVAGPILDPAVPRALLRQPPLVGRAGLLEELHHALRQPSSLKLALYGLPGVGKTTLAAALATDKHLLQELFPDGVLWAELGVRPHLSANLSRWSLLLGLSVARTGSMKDLDAWTRLLRDTIGQKRLLVVIDDAWTIEEALERVIGGPNCVYVLTTRLPEVALRFAGPHALRVPELGAEESATLLASYVPHLVETQAEAMQRLSQATGGLPLALKLMGTHLLLQTRHHQPRRLHAAIARLQEATERLQLAEPQAGVERDVRLEPGTPLSLQAVIALSETGLGEPEKQALSALCAFPSKPYSFSEEAALAVSGTSAETLDRLVDHGLVEIGVEGRYQLHQTIADYGQSRSRDQQAQEHLVSYLVEYSEQHRQENGQLDQESHLLLTGLEMAKQLGLHEAYLRMVLALEAYLEARHPYPMVELSLQQAILQARATDRDTDLLHLLGTRGRILREMGYYQEAEMVLREGLSLVTQPDTQEPINLLSLLGTVLAEQSQVEEARTCMDEAIARAERIGYRARLGSFYSNRGVLAYLGEDLIQAETFFLKAYALQQHDRTSASFATTLGNLGLNYGKRGNFALAHHYLQEAWEVASASQLASRGCGIQNSLGEVAYYQGAYEHAQHCYQHAMELAARQHNQRSAFATLVERSRVAIKMGQFSQAQTWQEEARALLQQENLYDKRGLLLSAQGLTALEQGDLALAQALFQHALDQVHQVKNLEWYAETLISLGVTLQRTGAYQEAQGYLREGLALAQKWTGPWAIGQGVLAWGEHALLQHEYSVAQEHFASVLRTISPEYRELVAHAHAGLAAVAEAQQQYAQARSEGQTALALFRQMPHVRQHELRTFLQALPDQI